MFLTCTGACLFSQRLMEFSGVWSLVRILKVLQKPDRFRPMSNAGETSEQDKDMDRVSDLELCSRYFSRTH